MLNKQLDFEIHSVVFEINSVVFKISSVVVPNALK